MFKRTVLMLAAVAASVGAARAALVQPPLFAPGVKTHTIAARWTDAWVVTSAATFSECNGTYTDNWLSGGRVRSHGHEDVPAGTPAHVDAVTVSAAHVTLSLTMSQSLLVTREYRDYTLHASARCQVDLKVLLPPGMSASEDILGVESLIQPLLRRFANEEAAVEAAGFGPGNETTAAAERDTALAQQKEFEERQRSEAVDARMGQWISQTSRIPAQISNDPDYLAGFARGVEAGKVSPAAKCQDLVSTEPVMQPARGTAAASFAAKGSRQKAWSRGYDDGLHLAQGLEAIRVLPQCAPATPSAAAR
jgi:phosphopantetheinyl transferase (holo-ACP synthase)